LWEVAKWSLVEKKDLEKIDRDKERRYGGAVKKADMRYCDRHVLMQIKMASCALVCWWIVVHVWLCVGVGLYCPWAQGRLREEA